MTVKPAEPTATSEPTPKGICATLRAFLPLRRSGAPFANNFPVLGVIVVAAVAAALIAGVAIVPAASASEGCPNEARRVEQGSTFLPDCRAYELVSQPSQPVPESFTYFEGLPPSQPTGITEPSQLPMDQSGVSIAQDGNAALFSSFQPNSESDSLRGNLSRRGSNSWIGENIVPRVSRHGFLCDPAGYVGFSPNLEEIAIAIGLSENQYSSVDACGHPEPELVPGESQESANLFLRNSSTGTFQLINVTPPGTKSYEPHLAAVSAGGSHVVFLSRAQLTANALNGEVKDASATEGHCTSSFGNVYEWIEGTVHLVTVSPEGQPVRGALAGGPLQADCGTVPFQSASFTHSVSTDGERAAFYAGGGFATNESAQVSPTARYIDGSLYLREHPGAEQSQLNSDHECTEAEKACTVQIDAPEAGATGASGGGQFQWANAETTKVFFTDEEKLTTDATAEAGKPDLYEYDLAKPEGQRLTDLTIDEAEAPNVLGVAGASEDGSYVYFVAKGDLTGGQENSRNAKAVAGEANLYLRHSGTTTFIATLNATGGDQCDWTAWCLTSRVSQSGMFIAFDSIDELTGYDNHPVHAEACRQPTGVADSPCIEAFRYAVERGASGELSCATCNPTGAPPAAEFAWQVIEQADRESEDSIALTNALSDSGQVFFETMEKLAPGDENETWDVYEYDGGEGSNAELHLISTGESELPSYFDDATPDGSNVFFVTDQSLLRADDRADYDLYDARGGGGFVAQDEPIEAPACEALEACRSPLTEPPAEFSVASASLSDAGNLVPQAKNLEAPSGCKKHFVHRHGKCVKQRRVKHKHHGQHKSHHHRGGKHVRPHGKAGK